MGRQSEIDLVGEILPVGLLKCRSAIEEMAPSDVLCIRTDDPGVVENVTKFLVPDDYRVEQQHHQGHLYLMRIFKRSHPE